VIFRVGREMHWHWHWYWYDFGIAGKVGRNIFVVTVQAILLAYVEMNTNIETGPDVDVNKAQDLLLVVCFFKLARGGYRHLNFEQEQNCHVTFPVRCHGLRQGVICENMDSVLIGSS
jgi:hypothetical protein